MNIKQLKQQDILTSEQFEKIGLDGYSSHYGHTFYCTNCQESNHRYIRKGLRIPKAGVKCERCGCSTR